MSGADRFGQFMLFLLFTIITLGIYPLYFVVYQSKERNALLTEIRDLLKYKGQNQ